MIETLSAPLICVIDDDQEEYSHILNTLNNLLLGCIHFRGNDIEHLPPHPINSLRLVFTDLYLSSGAVGKTMASHTANVFRRIVSSDTAPIIVVIWSKHSKEKNPDPSIPPEDQGTEAELFKRALFESDEKFRERLIFIEMDKPQKADQHSDWIIKLEGQIRSLMEDKKAIRLVWDWEKLVRETALSVSEIITLMACEYSRANHLSMEMGLANTIQFLVNAQKEGDLSPSTAPRFLSAVFGQLLIDQLDQEENYEKLSHHGEWLCTPLGGDKYEINNAMVNGFLHTTSINKKSLPFSPGSVYRISKPSGIKHLKKVFGIDLIELINSCLNLHPTGTTKQEWRQNVIPILIEISPPCDVSNNKRCNALLVAGVIAPATRRKDLKKTNGAYKIMPNFHIRWQESGFDFQEAVIVLCSQYKITLPLFPCTNWLSPCFRLRELPTASIRNWFATQTSRIGYVSL